MFAGTWQVLLCKVDIWPTKNYYHFYFTFYIGSGLVVGLVSHID